MERIRKIDATKISFLKWTIKSIIKNNYKKERSLEKA
jgi:hypothetical protein